MQLKYRPSNIAVISRIAPTPSGLIHLGNLYNFVLTWALVRKHGGKLHLRIDDIDGERTRPEYVDDIFETLEWIGLDWDLGPRDTQDFFANYSQLNKKQLYWEQATKLQSSFVCECSRKQVGKGKYPGTCLDKNLPYQVEQTCIRLNTQAEVELGDFVIWRKTDLPAYQLVSVVEDIQSGVNLIVRGEDLTASTQAQKYLAKQLGHNSFEQIDFIHHPLLQTSDGEKYSKSKHHQSIAALRAQGFSAKQVLGMLGRYFNLVKQTELSLSNFVQLISGK